MDVLYAMLNLLMLIEAKSSCIFLATSRKGTLIATLRLYKVIVSPELILSLSFVQRIQHTSQSWAEAVS